MTDTTRFHHLLQPIRDLALNWNIDIAHELTDYLDELETLTISLDEEHNSLNFAEAALVIQGITGIYSKKVEYLHALVYRTLEFLSNQKNKDSKENDGEMVNTETPEPSSQVLKDDNECILVDKKYLIEAKNITLLESSNKRATNHKRLGKDYQAIIALMGSLVPDERDHGDTFKLQTSFVHHSGVILIEQGMAGVLDNNKREKESSSTTETTKTNNLQEEDDKESKKIDTNSSSEDEMDDQHFDYDMEDQNHDVSHPPIKDNEENHPIKDNEANPENNNTIENQHLNTSMDSLTKEQYEKEQDFWEVLDPYDASKSLHRPYKKGKTFRERQYLPETRMGFVSIPSDLTQNWGKLITLGGIRHQDLTYIKRKDQKRRRIAQKLTNWNEKSSQRMLFTEKTAVSLGEEQDDDDNDFPCHDEYQDDDDDEYYNDLDPTSEASQGTTNFDNISNLSTTLDNLSSQESSYESLCRAHIESFMKGAESFVKETNLSKQVAEWQDKLMPILEEEDLHPPFDIQQCGKEIVTCLQSVDQPIQKPVAFQQLVQGKDSYEVCRLFLASLQLANHGNIELHHVKDSNDDDTPFMVNLINSNLVNTVEVYHDLIDDAMNTTN